MQQELATIRLGIEARLQAKVTADLEAGCMLPDSDAEALAGHILAVIQGLSTLARDGASREKLFRVAETAMLGWPDKADKRAT